MRLIPYEGGTMCLPRQWEDAGLDRREIGPIPIPVPPRRPIRGIAGLLRAWLTEPIR